MSTPRQRAVWAANCVLNKTECRCRATNIWADCSCLGRTFDNYFETGDDGATFAAFRALYHAYPKLRRAFQHPEVRRYFGETWIRENLDEPEPEQDALALFEDAGVGAPACPPLLTWTRWSCSASGHKAALATFALI